MAHPIRVSIVAIGNELLTGRVVDTNSAFIGEELFLFGAELVRVITVGDHPEEIHWALQEAVHTSDVVITSGGLGPTSDDITRDGVACICGVELYEDANSLERMRERYRKRNIPMNRISVRQCMFPKGSEVIANPVGTADAFRVSVREAGRDVSIFSLPGVPHELKTLFRDVVKPWLLQTFAHLTVPQRAFLQCFGLTESYLGTRIEEIGVPTDVDVAYRPVFPEVWITLRADERSASELEEVAQTLVKGLGDEFVYSREEGRTLSDQVGSLLEQRGKTISCAESCTGGMLSDRIVSRAGASSYFLGSVVSYANSAKSDLLGVPASTIAEHGAVSTETAIAMAQGVRKSFGSDLAISVTGIAGPEGGTPSKPVGTVFFGLSNEAGEQSVRFSIPYERNRFRAYAAAVGLEILRRSILGLPLAWERQ